MLKLSTSHAVASLLKFIRMESFAGILLLLASILALVLANSPWRDHYHFIIQHPLTLGISNLKLFKPILLWINDGLMAVFFLLIGLEVKREILEGQLSRRSQIILPGMGAIGGIIFPALIFVWFNYQDPKALTGWAIPTATDIAFALGVLTFLSAKVPRSMKVFLMALAIFDDLAAIIIIAIFYTSGLSLLSLFLASCMIGLLILLNYFELEKISVYLFIGALLWIFVLKSGVHATLSGVLLAFAIPLRSKKQINFSPLESLEKSLHQWVTYLILPLFAFANAGLTFSQISAQSFISPLTLGIALGLFLGKQMGIFLFCWISIKFKFSQFPTKSNFYHLYGASLLAGIGFTMSLFISSLAFGNTVDADYSLYSRLGILLGSLLSIVTGILVFHFCPKYQKS